MDEDFTSETTKPLATVVLSGEIDPFTLQSSELFSPELGLVEPATTGRSEYFFPKMDTVDRRN